MVTRLHKAIAHELLALEKAQETEALKGTFKLNPEQARHLIAVTRAVERVRVIHRGVADEARSRRDKRAIQDTAKSLEDLAQKIDSFIDGKQAREKATR